MNVDTYTDLFEEKPSSEKIGDIFRVINTQANTKDTYIVVKGLAHKTALQHIIKKNGEARKIPLSKWPTYSNRTFYWKLVDNKNELMAFL